MRLPIAKPGEWQALWLLTGTGRNARRTRLAWNGTRFARDSGLWKAARRTPHELEALTEWLEAGRP